MEKCDSKINYLGRKRSLIKRYEVRRKFEAIQVQTLPKFFKIYYYINRSFNL